MAKAFVTGGAGFLGSRVAGLLDDLDLDTTLLVRPTRSAEPDAGAAPRAARHRGDLLDPASYRETLRGSQVVLHMAALTGKAGKRDHLAVNLAATETLLEECRQAGVERFVFVSTIAVKYPNVASYPYALAKQRAEQAVRDSGLAYTIVRPTIIVGRDSPNLAALRRLACLPVIPVLGSGKTLVQPIHVDDAARFLVEVLADGDALAGQTLEAGGPEVLSIESLLRQIRNLARGRGGRAAHLPAGVVCAGLRLVEAVLGPRLLPVTAGQLAVFRYESTIAANQLHDRLRPSMKSVTEMLELSLDQAAPRA